MQQGIHLITLWEWGRNIGGNHFPDVNKMVFAELFKNAEQKQKAYIAVGLILSGSSTWARTRDTRINRLPVVFIFGAYYSLVLVPQSSFLHTLQVNIHADLFIFAEQFKLFCWRNNVTPAGANVVLCHLHAVVAKLHLRLAHVTCISFVAASFGA